MAAVFLGAARAVVSADEAELEGLQVVAIEIECTAPIDRKGLMTLLPMRVGDPLRAGDLERAQWLLTQTDIFTRVDVTANVRDNGVAVVIYLVRRPVVNSIRFRGNRALSNDQLFRIIRLRESMGLSDQLLQRALDRIRKRYADEGYADAEVRGELNERLPGEVDVTFRIREGVPLEIAGIVVEGEGLPVTAEEVQRATRLGPGDRYSRGTQRQAESAILRFFRSHDYYEVTVKSAWEPSGERQGFLRFVIDPGPRFELEFEGNEQFSQKKLLKLIDLPKRVIVTDGTWRELGRRIRRKYQEAGYYFARVDVRIEQGDPKIMRVAITEGGRYRIRAVNFEGNKRLSARLLRQQMETRPPSWIPWHRGVFLDDVFEEDLKRLWYFYRRYGFESAEIVDARSAFDSESGTVTLTVFIEEGRQTIVQRVQAEGLEVLPGPPPGLQTRVGEPLDPGALEADRQALLLALHRQGHGGATVQVEATSRRDGDELAATVRFVARPGIEQRVGAVVLQNNYDTRWRVLLRELPFTEGDPLNPEALLSGQSNIFRLGLFRTVTVQPLDEDSDAATRDVAVSVAERPPGTLQWGLGYNTRDGFRSFGEVGYNNLQGQARRLSLRGEFSLDPSDWTPDDYLGNLAFVAPRIGDTWWTQRTNLIAQRSTRTVDQFSIERFAAIPAVERRLLPDLIGRLEFQFEQAQVFDVAADVLAFNPRDAGRLRTVSVGAVGIYDGRDDPFVPRRGIFDSLGLRVAPAAFGSDVPFIEILGQHVQYIPLNEQLTFVYSLRGGWAWAMRSGEQVPIRYRFFTGGRSTVRGFEENSIGPTGTEGDPTGGDVLVNANAELRYPLLFGFFGAVFLDGGTVYLQNCPSETVLGCAIDFRNFRRSSGLGLRYVTPVGALSLDYGFKLDRRTGESIGEIHFSIGNIF